MQVHSHTPPHAPRAVADTERCQTPDKAPMLCDRAVWCAVWCAMCMRASHGGVCERRGRARHHTPPLHTHTRAHAHTRARYSGGPYPMSGEWPAGGVGTACTGTATASATTTTTAAKAASARAGAMLRATEKLRVRRVVCLGRWRAVVCAGFWQLQINEIIRCPATHVQPPSCPPLHCKLNTSKPHLQPSCRLHTRWPLHVCTHIRLCTNVTTQCSLVCA